VNMKMVENRTAEQPGHLEELYATHSLSALRFAYLLTGSREFAEDLMQEAFLKAFVRLGAIREQQAFPAYLRTTILNLARGHFRRRRIEGDSLRRHALINVPDAGLPDIDQRERLWAALQRLPHRQRAALVLRYYEDLSERDAARTLRITEPALKSLVARGTKTLRSHLASERRPIE
jgi:RNA polymerase sigma factor (sigma-70 family)